MDEKLYVMHSRSAASSPTVDLPGRNRIVFLHAFGTPPRNFGPRVSRQWVPFDLFQYEPAHRRDIPLDYGWSVRRLGAGDLRSG